jgi:phosphate starvation-inducible protein PhoH
MSVKKTPPRKRKERDVTEEFTEHIKKGFDLSNLYLKNNYPMTDNQQKFYYMSQSPRNNMVFVNGPAGSAKTHLAVFSALELLRSGHVDKIIYIRSVVESSSRSIGFLKGDENEKFLPYIMPMLDKLNEILSKADITHLMDNEYIKAIPVNFVRGLTFHRCAVIIDECFDDSVYIETDKGRVMLKHILKDHTKYKVLSFNEDTKVFEHKNILNTFKKGKKFISKMILDGRSCIKSTKNHRYLTIDGWKKMEELQIGDGIISSSDNKHSKKGLNDDQKHLIIGSILGDGHLHEVNPHSFRIKCIHGIKQENYLNFKANLINANNIKFIEKNGYAQKPAVVFTSRSFYFPTSYKDRKKYAIDNLSDKSLAISWQDDGYYYMKGKYGILCSCADSEEMNNLLAQKLNIMGYSCSAEKTVNGEGRVYYQVRFKVDGFDKMCKNISKYIHSSMSYKIPDKYQDLIETYEWNNKNENYSIRVVTNIDFDIEEKEVFDIEVEDNHNFIVSNMRRGDGTKIVAHNCQNMTKSEITTILTRFGKHSRYFVLGDAAQADIKDSGFISVYESFDTDFSRKNEIQCVEFDTSDIVRSQILKHITQVLRV